MKTMKALVYTAPGSMELKEVKLPERKPGFARIKVKYCGICGSDLGIYAGTHPRAEAPLIPGHEFVGVIEEINDSKRGFCEGDRVLPFDFLRALYFLPQRPALYLSDAAPYRNRL